VKRKAGRQKYEASMIAKFGVSVPMKNPAIEAQRRATNLERYGAEQIMQSRKVQKKYKKTLKDRYGADHVSQVPGVLEKAKESRFASTGYSGVNHAKTVITSRAKYGTDWPMQDPSVFQRNLNACFKHKTYILPSGAVVFLQGYEPLVLDYLLAHGYLEQEFLWMRKPAFWYQDKVGRNRRYHPDFVLPKVKLVIEVKAQKWWEKDRENILRKARAVQDSGWEFLLAVMGDNLCRTSPNPIQFLPFRMLQESNVTEVSPRPN